MCGILLPRAQAQVAAYIPALAKPRLIVIQDQHEAQGRHGPDPVDRLDRSGLGILLSGLLPYQLVVQADLFRQLIHHPS